jgi:Domain of unknown function (DUF4397)
MKTLRSILLIVLMLGTFVSRAKPASAATASFKLLHAAPDAGAYDIYLDTAKVATLSFTQFSTDVAVEVGTRQIRVFPAGNTTTPVVLFSVPFGANHKYMVVIAGRQANGLRPLVLTEPPIPARRYFRFRVVNLDPDNLQPIELINISNRVIIPSVAFTENKWATLPSGAGEYHLRIRVIGQPNPFVTLAPTIFESRKRYTVWVFNTNPPAGAQAAQRALPEMNMPNVREFQPNVFALTQD